VSERRGYHVRTSDSEFKSFKRLTPEKVWWDIAVTIVLVVMKQDLIHGCHVQKPSGKLAPFLMIIMNAKQVARVTLGLRDPARLCTVQVDGEVYSIIWTGSPESESKWFNFRIARLDDGRPTVHHFAARDFDLALKAYLRGKNLYSPLSSDWPQLKTTRMTSAEQSVQLVNAGLVEVGLPLVASPSKRNPGSRDRLEE
jgi:hypothetical protein